ncbi:MAG: Fe-S cluster assembly ATPase SufC, partial [Patescibacteria group bacterium]
LNAGINGKQILNGLSLDIKQGEIHAIMGPNGSGKSTLSHVIMGHPAYEHTGGEILLDGENISSLGADLRARRGIFLAFQYPKEIPGITLSNFLRTSYNTVRAARGEEKLNPVQFRRLLREKMKEVSLKPEFMERYINDGFSGGEKKKAEILQMTLLDPKIAILDETDSGLDVDALRIVSEGIKKTHNSNRGTVLITHYQRILHYITPDFVHVMMDGRIVKSGGKELAERLEKDGYDWVRQEVGLDENEADGLKKLPINN